MHFKTDHPIWQNLRSGRELLDGRCNILIIMTSAHIRPIYPFYAYMKMIPTAAIESASALLGNPAPVGTISY